MVCGGLVQVMQAQAAQLRIRADRPPGRDEAGLFPRLGVAWERERIRGPGVPRARGRTCLRAFGERDAQALAQARRALRRRRRGDRRGWAAPPQSRARVGVFGPQPGCSGVRHQRRHRRQRPARQRGMRRRDAVEPAPQVLRANRIGAALAERGQPRRNAAPGPEWSFGRAVEWTGLRERRTCTTTRIAEAAVISRLSGLGTPRPDRRTTPPIPGSPTVHQFVQVGEFVGKGSAAGEIMCFISVGWRLTLGHWSAYLAA